MARRPATDMPGRPSSISPSEHHVRFSRGLVGRNVWTYHTGQRSDVVQIEMLATFGDAPSRQIVINCQREPTRDSRDLGYPMLARIDETSWRIADAKGADVPPQTAFVLLNAPAEW